ncbi:MAG: endolytic transglycosylase MltG [Phycisphaerales bacterium]|nr:endolytic transglycosylase MltG [Phycisphaerales bacterium]
MGKILLSCLVLTTLGAVVLGVIVHQANRFWYAVPREGAETVTVVVDEGASISSLTPELARADLVHGFWFRAYAKMSGDDAIRPGTYVIARGENYAAILGRLRYGNNADVAITFPEGFTVAQMGERVVATFPQITSDDWAVATGQFSPLEQHPFVVAAGKPDDVDLEGYLFPDTYRFSEDATAEDIVQEMIDTMEEKYRTVMPDDFFGVAANLMLTPHEYLTLASIIEKEVRRPETMAMVADIFLKRLDAGMALQSDATINYVTGGDDPSVSIADTQIDSPYNTYKYAGLPPGPISNPGLNALAAVATPAANSYYYFLTTDDGEVYYATTHDEHVANKARYLR